MRCPEITLYEIQNPFFQQRFREKTVRPMTVALSQSAPGLGCGGIRVGFGEDTAALRGLRKLISATKN